MVEIDVTAIQTALNAAPAAPPAENPAPATPPAGGEPAPATPPASAPAALPSESPAPATPPAGGDPAPATPPASTGGESPAIDAAVRDRIIAEHFESLGLKPDEVPAVLAARQQLPVLEELRGKLGDVVDDPIFRKLADWRKAGGSDLKTFLGLQTLDVQTLSDVDAVKIGLRLQYPSATDEYIQAKLRKDYLVGVTDDEIAKMVADGRLDAADVALKRGSLPIQATDSKEKIRSAQASDLTARKPATTQDPAAMEALQRQFQNNVAQDLQALQKAQEPLKVSETESFEFAYTPDMLQQAAKALVIEDDQNGLLLVNTSVLSRQDMIKAIALYQSRNQLSSSVATSVAGKTEQRLRDEYSNRAPFGGASGGGAPASANPADQAIEAGVRATFGFQ